MANFPQISSRRAMLYPLERTNKWIVRVQQATNDKEQRWVSQLPKQEFNLTYTQIDGYSVSVIREFFNSIGGATSNTFSLDLGIDPETGVNQHWDNLVFVDDDIAVTHAKANLFNVSMKVRQVR